MIDFLGFFAKKIITGILYIFLAPLNIIFNFKDHIINIILFFISLIILRIRIINYDSIPSIKDLIILFMPIVILIKIGMKNKKNIFDDLF